MLSKSLEWTENMFYPDVELLCAVFLVWLTLIACSRAEQAAAIFDLPPLLHADTSLSYHVVSSSNVTWFMAEKLCTNQFSNGQLAVIEDYEVMGHMTRHMVRLGSHVWIGGHRLEDSWAWLDGRFPPDFSSAVMERSDCGAVYSQGDYQTFSCDNLLEYFLCQLPPDQCPTVNSTDQCTSLFHNSSSCIVICHSDTNPEVSWFEARNFCLLKNGDLASLSDLDLQQQVRAKVKVSLGDGNYVIWVGLRRKPWIWSSDGGLNMLELRLSFWPPLEPRAGVPSPACLSLDTRGPTPLWKAEGCYYQTAYFMCQVSDNSFKDESSTPQPSNASSVTESEEHWLSKDSTVILLSVFGGLIGLFLIITLVLIICLSLARKHMANNPTQRKTYFDYFDVGFFRKLMPRQTPQDSPSTVILTDTMIKDGGHSHQHGNSNPMYVNMADNVRNNAIESSIKSRRF